MSPDAVNRKTRQRSVSIGYFSYRALETKLPKFPSTSQPRCANISGNLSILGFNNYLCVKFSGYTEKNHRVCVISLAHILYSQCTQDEPVINLPQPARYH